MNLETFLQERRERIDRTLDKYLPSENKEPKQLHAAMRYAVLNGGKRLRPLLVHAVGEAFHASIDCLDAPAAAVEFIHAFSLIHDDLPAMDDDDFRRGRPSCHKAFDEAIAILAGDTLPWLAVEIICKHPSFTPEMIQEMISTLSKACGSSGLAGGQALDIHAIKEQGGNITIDQLENIYRMKTGALFYACIQLGALAADIKDQKQLETLDHYARDIGFAFQLQDDLLDIKQDAKPENKMTYPGMIGRDQTRQKANFLYESAMNTLETLDADTRILVALTNTIMKREY